MCIKNQYENCTKKNCNYAHSEAELMPMPNLAKTKMCISFKNGKWFFKFILVNRAKTANMLTTIMKLDL